MSVSRSHLEPTGSLAWNRPPNRAENPEVRPFREPLTKKPPVPQGVSCWYFDGDSPTVTRSDHSKSGTIHYQAMSKASVPRGHP